MNADGSFNEKESFNLLKKNFMKLDRIFTNFRKINFNDDDSNNKIEKYLQRFPEPSDFANQLEAFKNELDDHVRESKKARADNFRTVFNDYLNRIQKDHKPYRLIDKNTLRVGVLQVQTDPKNASVQFLFNRRVLMMQKNILSADDMIKYENECLKMLKNAEILEQDIGNIFYRAYINALRKRRNEKSFNPDYVLIVDFYTEVQTEIFKQQLLARKSDTASITFSFPLWAFLYNMDRYRKMRNISENRRLFFETGSQVETKKNGVVLNGLDPMADYKMFCYIRGSGAN